MCRHGKPSEHSGQRWAQQAQGSAPRTGQRTLQVKVGRDTMSQVTSLTGRSLTDEEHVPMQSTDMNVHIARRFVMFIPLILPTSLCDRH